MPQPSPPTQAETVKRRACDECRIRKLACSKDQGGCVRCKKEKLACHYSEQKPMGRPRKRQFIEVATEENGLSMDEHALGPELGFQPFNQGDFSNFDNHSAAEPYHIGKLTMPVLPTDATTLRQESNIDNGRAVWHFGDSEIVNAPPINFGNIGQESPRDSPPSIDAVPVLSLSPVRSTPEPCSCLASMYLALSSMQQFPSDITSALKVVRGAAQTAAASIWCPQCGAVVLDDPNPPIECFQNTMLLGTILPIITNGYRRLLKMVDDETEAAMVTGQTKTFQFQDYGGLCPYQQTVEQALTCFDKELLFNRVEMDPQTWRTTVRALLRVDIYGHEEHGFKHKGLKDLVMEMEQRQQARHALIDAQIIQPEHSHFGQRVCGLNPQPHNCLQILQIAKTAIDNLVIA